MYHIYTISYACVTLTHISQKHPQESGPSCDHLRTVLGSSDSSQGYPVSLLILITEHLQSRNFVLAVLSLTYHNSPFLSPKTEQDFIPTLHWKSIKWIFLLLSHSQDPLAIKCIQRIRVFDMSMCRIFMYLQKFNEREYIQKFCYKESLHCWQCKNWTIPWFNKAKTWHIKEY